MSYIRDHYRAMTDREAGALKIIEAIDNGTFPITNRDTAARATVLLKRVHPESGQIIKLKARWNLTEYNLVKYQQELDHLKIMNQLRQGTGAATEAAPAWDIDEDDWSLRNDHDLFFLMKQLRKNCVSG